MAGFRGSRAGITTYMPNRDLERNKVFWCVLVCFGELGCVAGRWKSSGHRDSHRGNLNHSTFCSWGNRCWQA